MMKSNWPLKNRQMFLPQIKVVMLSCHFGKMRLLSNRKFDPVYHFIFAIFEKLILALPRFLDLNFFSVLQK